MAGWQGLWTHEAGNPAGYSLLVDKNPIRGRAKSIVLRKSFRKTRELLDTLIGAASGSAASATHKEIDHASTPLDVGALGGARTITTITDISRNTTAADITALKEFLVNVTHRPTTYPRDLSGNGGPAA
jgi:hypothetical protein